MEKCIGFTEANSKLDAQRQTESECADAKEVIDGKLQSIAFNRILPAIYAFQLVKPMQQS